MIGYLVSLLMGLGTDQGQPHWSAKGNSAFLDRHLDRSGEANHLHCRGRQRGLLPHARGSWRRTGGAAGTAAGGGDQRAANTTPHLVFASSNPPAPASIISSRANNGPNFKTQRARSFETPALHEQMFDVAIAERETDIRAGRRATRISPMNGQAHADGEYGPTPATRDLNGTSVAAMPANWQPKT
jgi:hypothetical protein